MACRSTSTERRRAGRPGHGARWRFRLVAPLASALALCVAAARAHEPPPRPVREMVWIRGHVGGPAPGEKAAHELTLVMLGVERPFVATEWRGYALAEEAAAGTAPRPPRAGLQGSRSDLAPLVAARPEQRVTILAARRPGSSDLFVLAIDLCPAR